MLSGEKCFKLYIERTTKIVLEVNIRLRFYVIRARPQSIGHGIIIMDLMCLNINHML